MSGSIPLDDYTADSPEVRRGSELARQLVTACENQRETKDASLWNEVVGPVIEEIYAHFELAPDHPELLELQQSTVKVGHAVLRSLALMVVCGIDGAIHGTIGVATDPVSSAFLEREGSVVDLRRRVRTGLMNLLEQDPTLDSI